MIVKSYKYWTKEECAIEAQKFRTKTEFRDNASKSYRAALRNGWSDDICSHMVELIKPDNYWTKKRCQEVAKKCNYRSEFKNKYSGAYNVSLEKGWLDSVCKHMLIPLIWNKFWTKELCHEKALQYSYRKEFEFNHSAAYQAALKYNWIDEVCSHMKRLGSKVKRMIYAFEFPDKSVYVGLTYNSLRRKNEHLNPRKYTKSSVFYKIKNTNQYPKFIELTGYFDIDIAIVKECEYVEKYRNSGWIILNKIKTGGLGKPM